MSNGRNTLLSLGAALATTHFAHLASSFELDELLRPIGLSRRRRRWPTQLGFLAAGMAAGAAAALLLAPATGKEARAHIAKKAGDLGQAALKTAQAVREELHEEIRAADNHSRHASHVSAVEPT
jgi:hypothetical protein